MKPSHTLTILGIVFSLLLSTITYIWWGQDRRVGKLESIADVKVPEHEVLKDNVGKILTRLDRVEDKQDELLEEQARMNGKLDQLLGRDKTGFDNPFARQDRGVD